MMFPTNMVNIDNIGIMLSQSPEIEKTSPINRIKIAKAATLTPVDKNADIGAEEPSYTSGAYAWNGTSAILKPNPTSNKSTPK